MVEQRVGEPGIAQAGANSRATHGAPITASKSLANGLFQAEFGLGWRRGRRAGGWRLAADPSLRLRVLVANGKLDGAVRGVHGSDLEHPAKYVLPGGCS